MILIECKKFFIFTLGHEKCIRLLQLTKVGKKWWGLVRW